ncbi:MAG: putative Ig domain-containing protein [Calditrichaeota bacterium]|nr:putative Ig domain-containing protein [Calditrichota bacterium]
MRKPLLILVIFLTACVTKLDLANQAPIFYTSAVLKPGLDGYYSYQLLIGDPEGDELEVTTSELPSWLSFDSKKMLLSGLPTVNGIGSYPISIMVSDGKNTNTQHFTLIVDYLLSEAPLRAQVNFQYTFSLITLNNPSSVTVNQKPDWLDYDPLLMQFNGIPSYSDVGTNSVVYTMSDAIKGDLEYSFTVDVGVRFSLIVSSPVVDIARDHFISSVFQNETDSSFFAISDHQFNVFGGVGRDAFISKISASGSVIWQNRLPFAGPKSVINLSGSDLLFAAQNGQVGVINKANGNLIWSASFGQTGGASTNQAIETSDHQIAMIGSVNYSDNTTYDDLWLVKIDMSGNMLWEATFGGLLPEKGIALAEVSDGFILLANTASIGNGQNDFYLVKTDLNGSKVWEKTFGGRKNDKAEALIKAIDGSGFYLLGSSNSIGSGSSDAWLVKVDLNGNKVWDRVYGGEFYDQGLSLDQTTNTDLIIAIESRTQNNLEKNLIILKTDANGNIIWKKQISGAERVIYSIKATNDSGYVLGGRFRNSSQFYHSSWLLKIDADGNYD